MGVAVTRGGSDAASTSKSAEFVWREPNQNSRRTNNIIVSGRWSSMTDATNTIRRSNAYALSHIAWLSYQLTFVAFRKQTHYCFRSIDWFRKLTTILIRLESVAID